VSDAWRFTERPTEKFFARNRDLKRLGCRSQQMDASEREQYRRAIHGNREAFEMIIRTHSRTLFAIAYGILQNREEAEDVVQDSLVKAWKMRWRVRDPEKFPAWLSMIARHRAHDVFRKRRPDFTHETIEATEVKTPGTSAMDQQLHSALATLPELHRAALTLRYFEEMDYRAIENTLGLTNGALRGILGRALASLRKQLRPALASTD
jgi:RNA polymerase sigma-70 factor (ECF subfamily)